jgi:lipopolysaccharide/colanic/teichoic acid biosynthesis glycosyltransferase
MVLKRAIDIVGSLLLLLLLAPIFPLLAVGIKVGSRGPVFYRWEVVGQFGRPFTGYKFRSMVQNADKLRSQLMARNEMQGPVFKISDDPRVTRLGAWMRRYSIDEWPQFYSVFKGNMSLVGPRPPLVSEYAEFNKFHKQKLVVKPGITCLWQVSGRNRVSNFDDWVKLDLEYIQNWSLLLDFKILWRTVLEVLGASGK